MLAGAVPLFRRRGSDGQFRTARRPAVDRPPTQTVPRQGPDHNQPAGRPSGQPR